MVLGKYVSRAGIVGLSLILTFGAAALLASIWFGPVQWGVFVGVAALTIVYALAYVAVAIGISAMTATRSRAMLGALGFYFSTNLMTLNENVSGLAGLEYVLNDLLELGVSTDAIQFVGILTNPTRAYLLATLGVCPDSLTEIMALPVPTDLAWYVQPEIAVFLLIAWLIVPIAIGVRQFDRADIT